MAFARSNLTPPRRRLFTFGETNSGVHSELLPGLGIAEEIRGIPRTRVYADVAGFRLIGFGHRLAPGEAYPNGKTLAQGETILSHDLAIAEAAVERAR